MADQKLGIQFLTERDVAADVELARLYEIGNVDQILGYMSDRLDAYNDETAGRKLSPRQMSKLMGKIGYFLGVAQVMKMPFEEFMSQVDLENRKAGIP